MGKYVVESEFEDLHGRPDDDTDLELDLETDNPIIRAALNNDESWTPPGEDDGKPKKKDKPKDDDDFEDLHPSVDDDEDEDDLEEIDEEEDAEQDEEEAEETDDAEEDEDDEDDKYSKSVKKRIDRERQLRQKEKAEADAKLRRMERKLELRDAKDDLREFERETEAKLAKLRKKKVDALEEGETGAAVDVDDEILDLRAELKDRQRKVKELEDNLETDDSPDASGVPEAGRKWLEKYPEFHTNRQFNTVVLQADKMVAARGFDKNTDKYYAEIEKIVEVQFPEIIKKKKVQVTNKGDRRKKSVVGKTQKAGVERRRKKAAVTKKGVIRLTQADQASMKMFGLDPRNPQHAREWAANKTD